MVIPTILEKTGNGQVAYDLYSRLLEDRIIYMNGGVDDNMSNLVVAELLYLAKKDPDRDITIYVNSPGGSVVDGLAIYDVMQYVPCDINTVCVGLAASMGSIILMGGTKGKRFILPNSEVLIHQPLVNGGIGGQITEIEIFAKKGIKIKKQTNEIIALHTGKPFEQVEKDTDRDNRMDAQQALEYGIVDKILEYHTPVAK